MSYPAGSIERRKVGWRAWSAMPRLNYFYHGGWYQGTNWVRACGLGIETIGMRSDEEGISSMIPGKV